MRLIIDTCLPACSVVLADGSDLIAAETVDLGVGHAEHIGPQAAQLFTSAQVAPHDVTEVVATVGPGSFMGVRVGVSFAKGFAAARGLPTRPVSIFDALAHSADGPVDAVVIDARRGQVFARGRGIDPPEGGVFDIETISEIAEQWDADRVVGSGAALVCLTAPAGPGSPTVSGLVAAAAAAKVGALEPAYVRPPDARRAAPPAPMVVPRS